jgi:class 3 adenylate cyclase/tetratricopeptide (TPR) repeat protein
MAAKCPGCGASNKPGAKFCNECASPLEAPGSLAKIQSTEEIQGERRHLTVLFCDLVNSTEIAAHLDPEEWRDIAARYQRSAGEAVTRLGGHVAKYLGDGLVVYFGYPQAHEDDAERAVRGGLAIVDAIAMLNQRNAVKLAVRVGIHTGSVVVGQGGGTEADVFGDAPNLASRVQAVAEPDTVVITAPVHQLVSGLFVVENRGAHALKGIELPVQLYRAIQPSVVRRRTHGAAARVLTPFVGRDDEMRLLLSRWERACEGEGQLVVVAGEAGIGKSRLIEEFRARIKPMPHLWIECAGEQFFENTPFHAVTQMLNQGLGWRGDESNEERVIQIERSLELSAMKLAETVPLIAEMLSLPIPEKYSPLMFAPDQKRKRLLAALAGWVFGATRTQPLVLALEDLHWVDPSTLELMLTLVEQAATAPLMLLFTTRPEFRPPWAMRAHHAQITLNRLSDRQTREMVAGVAARSALTKDVIDTVVKRTDGVPLFAEELTRLIMEGDGRSIAREIPATLHDSLTARLDRLGEAREVAQVAAVIGREFSYELLQAVLPIPENELQSALAKLADAELIYARGIPPEATYQFKHALIQDAAYEALLKTKRKELHRRVAATIAEKFTALAEAQPEVLARHWSDAGEGAFAIGAWQKAADRAIERGAFVEAEVHLRQALAVLDGIAETEERDSRELTLQLALGGIMVATRGWSAVDTAAAYTRARTLAERAGEAESLQVFSGLWHPAITRCELRASLALADQVFEIARRIDSPQALVTAHFEQGLSRFYLGDPVAARHHFLQAVEHYREEDFRGIPDDHGMNSFAYLGHTEWLLGYLDQALRHKDDAISLARNLNKPFGLGYAYTVGVFKDCLGSDFKGALSASQEIERISTEWGFPLYRAATKIITPWARSQLGETNGAVSSMREGFAEFDTIEFYLMRGFYLCLLSETQALTGAVDDALVTVERALEINPDELMYRPSTIRQRGELRLKIGQPELAETDFRDAIALAKKMSAKSFELRATTSLARLLAKQRKRDEARMMLAEIYGWFTEGFDTADLKDAKALLEELGGVRK